jgi:hypothetical protein
MSSSADTVTLQAYDLQGNIFYTYDFLHSTGLEVVLTTPPATAKRWQQNQMLIYHDERIYDVLGKTIR